jgi:hypothetical protein
MIGEAINEEMTPEAALARVTRCNGLTLGRMPAQSAQRRGNGGHGPGLAEPGRGTEMS